MPEKSAPGYISIILIVLLGIFALLVYPYKFPIFQKSIDSTSTTYCRPDPIDPNGPTFKAKSRNSNDSLGEETTYQRIKSNVPVRPKYRDEEHAIPGEFVTIEGRKFQVYYPAPQTGNFSFTPTGMSTDFFDINGQRDFFEFYKYGVVFAQHLNDDGEPVTITVPPENPYLVDIYKDINKEALPETVLQCSDAGTEIEDYNKTTYVAVPSQLFSPDNKQLQFEWFVFNKAVYQPKAWWVPHCKPAIYLYPKEKTLINVKVQTKGFLTLTIPQYDADKGWTVWANPDGVLTTNYPLQTTNYPYLYYESKVPDKLIKKPGEGYVVKYEELSGLYKDLLPKLGLNSQQTSDFVEYWTKALQPAPYYFVGVMDQENVNFFEPLEITPKPDYMNRVRIYFERLDSPKFVTPPDLPMTNDQRLTTDSFRVIEWGGMVKNDKDHPFTCSQ